MLEGQVLRAIASLSQKVAAERLGIDGSTMSRWLESENGLPRACALLSVLGFKLIDERVPLHDTGYVEALETIARRQLDQRRAERG